MLAFIQLAAIMFAGITGHTALMHKGELQPIQILKIIFSPGDVITFTIQTPQFNN